MTLRDVIARLDEFEDEETIFAEAAMPTAQAVVAVEAADGCSPSIAVGLRYLLEVPRAREAIEVWRAWRPGQTPPRLPTAQASLWRAVSGSREPRPAVLPTRTAGTSA